MSKNPNKWDGIIAAMLTEKGGDFGGLFDVIFSHLERKTDFFADFSKLELLRSELTAGTGKAGRLSGKAPQRTGCSCRETGSAQGRT